MLVKYLGALTEQLEPDRPVLLVSTPRCHQFSHIVFVDLTALALPVGPIRATTARPIFRTLIPIHAQPGQTFVDQREELLAVALLVGVLDAQDKHATRVSRVEPIEERRAGAADMEETGGTGCKTNANG